MSEAKWYVVHTYSGYENKVKANIEKTIENRHLEDQILEVRVPLQEVVEMRNGAAKQVQKKMFPGYVLLNMVMNDDTWYVVRNTRGCTGFVGPEGEPQPLTDEEVRNNALERVSVKVNYEVGDLVNVVDGPLEGFSGTVDEIDVDNNSVKVTVSMFGRENQVEFELDQLEKVQED